MYKLSWSAVLLAALILAAASLPADSDDETGLTITRWLITWSYEDASDGQTHNWMQVYAGPRWQDAVLERMLMTSETEGSYRKYCVLHVARLTDDGNVAEALEERIENRRRLEGF